MSHTPHSSGRTRDVVVIGAGNGFRSDDGVGLFVAARVRECVAAGVRVVALEGGASEVMAAWRDCDAAIIVDAVCSGAHGGHVHRFNASEEKLPSQLFRFSTHAFGVVEAIELGRVLGTLPPKVIVYGIEGTNFNAGTDITPEVARAADDVVARVVNEVEGGSNA